LSLAQKENEELRARLLAAEERAALSTKIAAPQPTKSEVPTSSTPGAPVPVDELNDIKKQLAQLNEVVQRKKLEDEQVKSLHTARQFIPGIAAGDQKLIKAATDILARDPLLQKHPQGPMLAAALASSLSVPGTPSAGQRAGLTTPTQNTPMSAIEATNAAKQVEELKSRIEEVRAKMRSSSGGSDHWATYKTLLVQLGELQKNSK
jgi:hypothetical protein